VLHRRRIEGIARSVARELKTDIDALEDRVEALLAEIGAKEREMGRMKEDMMRQRVEEAVKSASEKDGARIISMFLPSGTPDDLRKVTDMMRDKLKSCVAVVGTKDGEKGLIVAAVTKDLSGIYSAGQIIKSIAAKYDGRGGGNPQMAQGGVPADRVEEALGYVKELLGA